MNYIDHIKGYLSRAALLLLMAGGALMAGCEDFLVRDVPNQTTDEEWWQNKGQLNTALNNLYKPMPSGTITYVNHDVKQSQASGYPNARVEMEALTGVNVALLTIYDMCKAMDRAMEIFDVHLEKKDGGKSGLFERSKEREQC